MKLWTSSLFKKQPMGISSEKVAAKHGLRQAQFGALSRLPNFALALSETAKVDGVIVEVGVGSGLSLATLLLLKNVLCPHRKIFAFDSFRSFPPGYVDGSVNAPEEGVSLLEHTKDNLRLAGANPDEVTFVEGYINDTIPLFAGNPVAILHLDVDLGRSYSEALKGFWPHVQSGGIVIFDEYDNPRDLEKWPDAKIAIDDFFADRSFDALDQSYLTRRIIVKR